MSATERPVTYSVFVRFRKKRLTMSRPTTLATALRLAADMRLGRFHGAEDIMVVNDSTGEIVDEGAVEGPPALGSSGSDRGTSAHQGGYV